MVCLLWALQRSQFGRRSERLDEDQLQLGLEELDGDIARAEAALPDAPVRKTRPEGRPEGRLSLPNHLPREDTMLDIDTDIVRYMARSLPLALPLLVFAGAAFAEPSGRWTFPAPIISGGSCACASRRRRAISSKVAALRDSEIA